MTSFKNAVKLNSLSIAMTRDKRTTIKQKPVTNRDGNDNVNRTFKITAKINVANIPSHLSNRSLTALGQ